MTNDLIGHRFGRLTVLQRAFSKPNKGIFWLCRCDCDSEATVLGSKLLNGHTRSCGCLRRNMMTTHGHSGNGKNRKRSPTYQSWQNMISRCTQPSNPAFEHYKKRKITVCDQWRDFKYFLADMGERPEGMTLDRIDNNGNYEPKNCRWATKREQANNRITNNVFLYSGKEYTLADLARTTGTSKDTLRVRLVRPGGWTVKDAVETPTIPRHMRGTKR